MGVTEIVYLLIVIVSLRYIVCQNSQLHAGNECILLGENYSPKELIYFLKTKLKVNFIWETSEF